MEELVPPVAPEVEDAEEELIFSSLDSDNNAWQAAILLALLKLDEDDEVPEPDDKADKSLCSKITKELSVVTGFCNLLIVEYNVL